MKQRKLKKEVKIAIFITFILLIIMMSITVFTSIYNEDYDKNNEILAENNINEDKNSTNKNDINENKDIKEIASIPKDVNDLEITKYLEEFQKRAKEDSRYNEIIRKYKEYPKDILKLLYTNEETLNFVLSKSEMKVPSWFVKIDKDCGDGVIPNLQQWDLKWGWYEYGENVIAINGCGPTALSMVVSGLTGNKSITPIKIAKYSDKHGFHEAAGTNWNLMIEGAKKYGINGWKIDNSKEEFEKALKNGNPIICSMGPGYFTKEGHFIVIAGIKDGKLVINDPNSIKRSEKLWDYDDIKSQIKAAWAYSNK